MNDKHEDIVIEIMQAIENGVSVVELEQRLPEHRGVIAEILTTRELLGQAATMIPLPVTKSESYRIIKTEGSVISPYINKLISSMNYKIAVPVLVFGLVAVSGSVFLFGQKGHQNDVINTETIQTTETTQDTTNVTNEDMQVNDSNNNGESAAETKPVNSSNSNQNTNSSSNSDTNNQVVSDAALDDVLSGFTVDATNEQTMSADDGVTGDMFAEGELSDFEIDDYVY